MPASAPKSPPPAVDDTTKVPKKKSSMAPRVFWPAAGIMVAFVLFAMIFPGTAQDVLGAIQENVIGVFGWYYVVLVAAFVVFSIWVGVSHFGDIKLGKDDEKAEFRFLPWLGMLFAAGMGIGLVFFGVAEPLGHFASPKPGTDTAADPTQLAEGALVQTFLHWGLQPWAIYVVVGLAIAYSVHRRGRPVSIRWALEPLLGDRVKGKIGDAVDVIAIVGTLFGVATSLGFGVLQVAAGLDYINLVDDPGTTTQILLIIGITALATLSVVSGVKKGIKWLSNINVGIAGALLLYVLAFGPTLFLLREFVQATGSYLQNFVSLSFDVTAMQGMEGQAWQAGWTIFYWGWWISWAPFVGVFIARISRGRTVREFVAGVLLVPTVFTFLWFTVLGGTALYRELNQGGGLVGADGSVDTEGSLFALLDGLPLGGIASVVTIVLIIMFFVTSSDSGSLVVDMLSSGGDPEPPTWSRIFWSITEGLVAIALLVVGGEQALAALQTVAILIALPFSVVMIAMAVALWKEFSAERKEALRIQRRRRAEELTVHVSRSLIEDGLITTPEEEAVAKATTAGGAKVEAVTVTTTTKSRDD
ncbi:choline/carnitine/betaine transport [Actinoalloteichus sp. GBA129-24]|uniref:Choline/carnitine/betaine transport n=2 Tax=Pseudonocardiaceae TaxID=2070 RepID=A0AAC9LD76_9PSEU|nr:choline/carnitine/betaine transport [Actinoalloteichus fjordicus]APU20653.1 choline/carnitine/betaine transport [Actinoalloteichus sp. GBA129-24]